MSNPFYTATGNPATGSEGLSALMRAEFMLIQTGFDTVPAIQTEGLFTTTLVQSATLTFTLPSVSGTFALLSDVASQVAAEATLRTAGDATNAAAIATETTNRGTVVAAEATTRAAADTAETVRAVAAETALVPGRLLNGVPLVLTSSGYAPTPAIGGNAGMSHVIFEYVGAGGGTGGVASTGGAQNIANGGGGAGAYGKAMFTAAQIAAALVAGVVPITIGAGGAAGATGHHDGGAGGATLIGAAGALVSCPGGGAGTSNVPSNALGAGGAGGAAPTVTGGVVIESAVGAPGGNGLALSGSVLVGGTGGHSHFGATAPGAATLADTVANPAVAGGSPGAGATGPSNNTNCGNAPGAVGAGGYVLAWELT